MTLNATNLSQLDLLVKRQALFCHELVTVFAQDITHLDREFDVMFNNHKSPGSLQKILMQVTHPEEENCAFFHAIDSNCNRRGTLFSLLPSAAQHFVR